jgi:N-acetylglutamate synthase-like GNAT family acetyltransferase
LLQNCSKSSGFRSVAMNEIKIRLAELSDAPAIALLLSEAFVQYRPLYTQGGFEATAISAAQVTKRMDEGPIWVAICENVIAGTISVVRKHDSLYLRGMAVCPKARGRRIGERLLNQAEDHATRQGIDRLFLSTTPFLDRAIHLYEKCGYRRTDEGPHELFGTPLFTMEKFLSGRQLKKDFMTLIG